MDGDLLLKSFVLAAVFQIQFVYCVEKLKATCLLRPNDLSDPTKQVPSGVIKFEQDIDPPAPISIEVNIVGLDPVDPGATQPHFEHGFHVHELGDIATGGCNSVGGHYNPFNEDHRGPDDHRRHMGDLGNLIQTPAGTISTTFTDNMASLFEEYNIIGRAIVIHKKRDDLGRGQDANSKINGNAGKRLACCVIGRA